MAAKTRKAPQKGAKQEANEIPEAPRAIGEQGERTRRKLLQAAKDAFRERGFHGTKVDDITTRAGTSHGAFYLYFTNKEEVLEALAVETSDQMHDLAWKLEGIEAGEPGYSQLRSWVGEFVDRYREHAPVLTAWIQADQENPRFDQLGREMLGKIAGEIAHVIHVAQEESPGGRAVNPPVAATALVAMLERFCYFWIVRGAEFDREAVLDTMATVWYEAIFGPLPA